MISTAWQRMAAIPAASPWNLSKEVSTNGYESSFPGALSTFQDQGRIGFQKYGITSSGSMDVRSAAMANALVRNDPKEAVLEMTVLGPMLQFSSPAVAAVAGAPMPITLNQKPVPMNTSFSIHPGDLLSFGGVSAGCRSYLAVKGGFALEPVMGSCST